MSEADYTTIRVSKATKARLEQLGSRNESFDKIVTKLLDKD
jgi:hypothetical protein